MDRRRVFLAAVPATALSIAGEPAVPAVAQTPAPGLRLYTGAMRVMWRSVASARQDLDQLLGNQNREDQAWRIDVLAPFAVVRVIRDSARLIRPPARYASTHETWLDALDQLVAAGLFVREGVLRHSETAFSAANRALTRAATLIAQVETELPRRMRPSP